MKLLITIIMSTVVSVSAFGACGVGSPKDCTSKSTCEGLSTSGMKFSFSDTTTPKCMTVDTSVAANCLEVYDAKFGKGAAVTTGAATGTSTGTIDR